MPAYNPEDIHITPMDLGKTAVTVAHEALRALRREARARCARRSASTCPRAAP